LETQLGGARLTIGGYDAPLFFSADGQINAQIPFELPANSQPQLLLRTSRAGRPAAIAVPQTVTVAAERPGIFAISQIGTGQGTILNQDSSVNSASNPATRGSVIQIFATGLGATNPSVPSGQPAPTAEPLARAVTLPEVQIGGIPARLDFAGLAPGLVGLYQVNVEVPATVNSGSAVPLVLVQSGVSSNIVTVAIQ
jgi:uncharacterized protein (TIGR03437 family)